MKVRVERIRRGRRTAEVEYVEAAGPRRRRPLAPVEEGKAEPDLFGQEQDAPRGLRLPWQIRSGRK